MGVGEFKGIQLVVLFLANWLVFSRSVWLCYSLTSHNLQRFSNMFWSYNVNIEISPFPFIAESSGDWTPHHICELHPGPLIQQLSWHSIGSLLLSEFASLSYFNFYLWDWPSRTRFIIHLHYFLSNFVPLKTTVLGRMGSL